MPIYTRTGDQGQTGLLGGSRVSKTSARVEAYGSVDEADAAIGFAKTQVSPSTRKALDAIQQRLIQLAGELAADERGATSLSQPIGRDDVTGLERLIDDCMAEVGPQHTFVVPGDDAASAALHQARAVMRRAERRVLAAAVDEPVRSEVAEYINRLSDALHALALVEARRAEVAAVEKIIRRAVEEMTYTKNRQGVDMKNYDLGVVKKAAEAAEAKGLEMGVPIVFAAVDDGGNIMLVHRQDDSLLASIDLAINKAFTAVAMRQSTAALTSEATAGGTLPGLENSNGGRLVVFGGGVPVMVDGQIVGGIGVSGGTVAQDEIIVDYAFQVLKEG